MSRRIEMSELNVTFSDEVHRDMTAFELSQGAEHAGNLISKIRQGTDVEPADAGLAVFYDHILDHLCRGWHCVWSCTDGMLERTPDQFIIASDTLPNWNRCLTLLDSRTLTKAAFRKEIKLREAFNRSLACKHLKIAQAAMDQLAVVINAGSLDGEMQPSFGQRFLTALEQICLSRHLSYLDDDVVRNMKDAELKGISHVVPWLGTIRRLLDEDKLV